MVLAELRGALAVVLITRVTELAVSVVSRNVAFRSCMALIQSCTQQLEAGHRTGFPNVQGCKS